MGFFTGLLGRLGFSQAQFVITASIITILLTTIGLLWLQKNSADTKLLEQAGNIVQLTNDVAVANDTISQLNIKYALIDAERKRLDSEMRAHLLEKANAKPLIEEKIKYVKVYQNDPTIAKCDLSPQWVYGHNQAATSNYIGGLSNTGTTEGAGLRPTTTQATVNDGEVLEVVTENYTACDNLRHDYIKLKNLYKARTSVKVVIPSGG
jgi:hypothetical protein